MCSAFQIPDYLFSSILHPSTHRNWLCGSEDQTNLGRKQVGQMEKNSKTENSPPTSPKQSTNSIAVELLCDLSEFGLKELRKPEKTEVMSTHPRRWRSCGAFPSRKDFVLTERNLFLRAKEYTLLWLEALLHLRSVFFLWMQLVPLCNTCTSVYRRSWVFTGDFAHKSKIPMFVQSVNSLMAVPC